MSYVYYYPPSFTYHHCVYMPPEYVEGKMVALVRDEEGKLINSFEYERIDETPIYCALITTPEEEGVYFHELVFVDLNNNIVSFLEAYTLIVSNNESLIGWLLEILKMLESIQGGTTGLPSEKLDEILEILNSVQTKLDSVQTKLDSVQTKLDSIQTKLNSIQTKLNSVLTKINETVTPTLQQILTRINETVTPTLQQILTRINETVTPTLQQILTRINETVTPTLQQILSWVKTRKA